MAEKGKIYVLTGPSGVGKGTVLKSVVNELGNVQVSTSATTRKIRDGEVDGVNYFFKTKEQFEKMIEDNELIEWAEFAGNYYGTPRDSVEKILNEGNNVVLEIEVQGARQIKEKCNDAILVFLEPPSFEELEKRLRERGTESPEKIELRLNTAREELNQKDIFDYVVVNDDLEKAIKEVCQIIA